MTKYNKIETLYKRNVNGDKKLIVGEFRNPTIEYLKDNKWEFTEKIDGTNISIVWDGFGITFHGRTEKAQIPSFLLDKLNNIFQNI